LLEHREKPQKKVQKGLEKIVERATSPDGYETPEDLKNAIESYRKSVTRRRFLKVAGGGIALAGLGYGGFEYLNYRNSIDYIVKQIENTDADDYERMDPLLIELGERICYSKIMRLYDEGRIKAGEYPYATNNGVWYKTDSTKSTAGRWVRILRNASLITDNPRFAELADEAASGINFDIQKERGLQVIRFFHAQKDILEAVKYYDDLSGEGGVYNSEIGFYDIGSAFSNRFDSVSEDERIISINSLNMILPLVLTASKIVPDPVLSKKYLEHVIRHTNVATEYLIRDDGSTRDLAKFNIETGEIIEGNYFAHKPWTCHGLSHIRAIDWFATMYEQTQEGRYRETASKLMDFYVSRLPDDYISYYDIFYDPNVPNNRMPGDMPKNTAAALRMCSTLAKHDWLLIRQEQKSLLYHTLQSVIVNYADTDKNSEAIITGMCDNYRTKSYMNSCIVRGVDNFLEIIRIIE